MGRCHHLAHLVALRRRHFGTGLGVASAPSARVKRRPVQPPPLTFPDEKASHQTQGAASDDAPTAVSDRAAFGHPFDPLRGFRRVAFDNAAREGTRCSSGRRPRHRSRTHPPPPPLKSRAANSTWALFRKGLAFPLRNHSSPHPSPARSPSDRSSQLPPHQTRDSLQLMAGPSQAMERRCRFAVTGGMRARRESLTQRHDVEELVNDARVNAAAFKRY